MSLRTRKTFIWGALAVAGLQLSSPSLANDRLKAAYKKAAAKYDVADARRKTRVTARLNEAAKKLRSQYAKNLDRQSPGLLAELKKQAERIQNSRLTAKEKAKELRLLLRRHERELRTALRFSEPLIRQFRADAVAILRAYKCLFDAFFNVVCSDQEEPDVVIPEDVIYTATYGDIEEQMSSQLIGFGDADANRFAGRVSVESTSVDAGTFYAKAGMVETVTVPTAIDKVKVTAKTNLTYEIISFAVLGVSGGYVDAYLSVFGDNAFQCDQQNTLAANFAPLLYVTNATGSQVTTLTCEFTPNSLGGQYVIAAGAVSNTTAVFPSASLTDADGPVESIQVQFINE